MTPCRPDERALPRWKHPSTLNETARHLANDKYGDGSHRQHLVCCFRAKIKGLKNAPARGDRVNKFGGVKGACDGLAPRGMKNPHRTR
jgi:hypothetical protein